MAAASEFPQANADLPSPFRPSHLPICLDSIYHFTIFVLAFSEVLMSEQIDELKMCELKAKGLMEEIDRRSSAPTVICGKCRAKANRPEQLHNPLPLKKSNLDNFWG
jgi:hypothetical protein